jgi:hypothetical protein
LSVLGKREDDKKVFSTITRRRSQTRVTFWDSRQQNIITTPVDVIVLGMIKTSDIDKIKFGQFHIEIDPSLITLFVSEEKYQNRKFLDENYNKTVAKHLRNQINDLRKYNEVKVKIVPDSILKEYYYNPYSIKTNSIFEIMEIDKQVKEKVFGNIKDKLVV